MGNPVRHVKDSHQRERAEGTAMKTFDVTDSLYWDVYFIWEKVEYIRYGGGGLLAFGAGVDTRDNAWPLTPHDT